MLFSDIQNRVNDIFDDMAGVLPNRIESGLSKLSFDWWGMYVQPYLDVTDRAKEDLEDVGLHSLLGIVRENVTYLLESLDMEDNEISDLVDSLDEMESAWSSPSDIDRFTRYCILEDLDDLRSFCSFVGNQDILDEVNSLITDVNDSDEIDYDTEALRESINTYDIDLTEYLAENVSEEINGRDYDPSKAFDFNKNSLTELHTGVKYGSNALNIYDKCCDDFGWDSSLRGCFKNAQLLNAPYAAENGKFGVWFIAVSNCDASEEVISRNKRRVHFYGDLITVVDDGEKYSSLDETPEYRLTFVKKRVTINEMNYTEDMYYYMGLYCCNCFELDPETGNKTDYFELVSGTETYPFTLSEEDENAVMEYVSAKNYADELKSFAIPENINTVRGFGRIHEDQSLRYLVSYGSNAGRIYRSCVGRKGFAWEYVDENLVEFMRKTGYIFFPHATSEDFDIWFISGSNINRDEDWINSRPKKCYVHKDSVVEVDSKYSRKSIDVEMENKYRLVFVKKNPNGSGSKFGDYVYYGVFYCTFVYRDKKSGELTREFTRIREYDTYYGRKCRGDEKTNCPVCGTKLFTKIINETAREKAVMLFCEKCDTKFVEIIDL